MGENSDVVTDAYEISRLFRDWVRSTFTTQKEAAKELELSEQYLSDILRDNRPVPQHLMHHTGYKLAWVKIDPEK